MKRRQHTYSLLTLATNKANFIFNIEHRRRPVFAAQIPDLAFYRARETLIAIWTCVCKHDALLSMSMDRSGAGKVLLAPAFLATVQTVWPLVLC